MEIDIELLARICEVSGAPGFENRIRTLIIEEIKDYVDHYEIDNIGNLTAIKRGDSSKKVMVAAHMDEIGFIVKHIDDDGFVRFLCLGGFDPKTHTAQRVVIQGKEDVIGVMGSKPIHVMTSEERSKVSKSNDYFIDLGRTKEEVEKLISIGDPITRERKLIEIGDNVNCKSLDNRVSVYILIEALRNLKTVAYDTYAVFTVQEEVGIRGASAATLAIEPDFGICLDTTIAYDVPGAKPEEIVTKLGGGTAVKIMDSRTICDSRMVQYLKDLANSNNLKWQTEILPAGGTDTSALQRMTAGGSIAGAISIPTRHIHQVVEMVSKNDILESIKLLNLSLENLKNHNWSF